jgi:hypothetical protein
MRSFVVQLLALDGVRKQGMQDVSTHDRSQHAFDALELGDGFKMAFVQLWGDLVGSKHISVAFLVAQVGGAEFSSLLELASIKVFCIPFCVQKYRHFLSCKADISSATPHEQMP